MGSLIIGNSLICELCSFLSPGLSFDTTHCLHHHLQVGNQKVQFIAHGLGTLIGKRSEAMLDMLQPYIVGDIPLQPKVAYISLGSTDLLQGESPSVVADQLITLGLDIEYNLQVKHIIIENITNGTFPNYPSFPNLSAATNQRLSTLADSYGFHLHNPAVQPLNSGSGPTLCVADLPNYWTSIMGAITRF